MSGPAKKSTSGTRKTASRKKKETLEDITPLMAYESSANVRTSTTGTRRNKSSVIDRTDRFKNIDDGLVPFKYAGGQYGGSKSMDVRDAVVLCQKAYYNFSQFRNVVDLMTEFSLGTLYFKGGTKKSRKFFEALLNKLNIWDFQDKFFREYYRSGNVFVYRFNANLTRADFNKITQTFGNESKALDDSKIKIPASYVILNPADIKMTGSLSFNDAVYSKVITNYELERLRNPRTEEDKEIYDSLDPQTKKSLKSKKASVEIPLSMEKINAIFYKKQDYEPFAVPMGYPVLGDISFKEELKKMDMAIGRCMQQAILLITMGTDPDKGGINQKNLQAMQKLFENESVGRVLIADYTTKAEFVVPRIADLMDSKKYEIFDRDINLGLNNILVGGEKFSNQESKIKVFVSRLEQGRQAFVNNFLIPEIKNIAKSLGFKNYPTPYFEEMSLQDSVLKDRVYSRLLELGILTPDEALTAIESGRLPDKETSLENQKEFLEQKNEGLYSPLIGGAKIVQEGVEVEEEDEEETPKEAGRPDGTEGIPQESTKVTPVGQGEGASAEAYSVVKIKENMLLAQKLESSVGSELRKIHKVKRLNKNQKDVAIQISEIIVANEKPEDWNKSIKKYCKKPIDQNLERVEAVREIAAKHQLDFYLASILANSIKEI